MSELAVHSADIDLTLIPEPLIKTAFLVLGERGQLDIPDDVYAETVSLNVPGSQILHTRAIAQHYPSAMSRLSPAVVRRTAAEVAEQAEASIFPEMREVVDDIHGRGEVLVLISSGPDELVRAFGWAVGAKAAVGREHVPEGWIRSPYKKGEHLLCLCSMLGGRAVTAYGDGPDDVSMLQVAERPVAVNPQPALLKEAQSRNWPILWCEGQPGP